MHALKYTSREVNRNFRIKVSGLGIHELKGFTGFVTGHFEARRIK